MIIVQVVHPDFLEDLPFLVEGILLVGPYSALQVLPCSAETRNLAVAYPALAAYCQAVGTAFLEEESQRYLEETAGMACCQVLQPGLAAGTVC